MEHVCNLLSVVVSFYFQVSTTPVAKCVVNLLGVVNKRSLGKYIMYDIVSHHTKVYHIVCYCVTLYHYHPLLC